MHLSHPETISWTNQYRENREVKGHLSAIISQPFQQCGNLSMAVDTCFGSPNLRCNSLSRYGSNLNYSTLSVYQIPVYRSFGLTDQRPCPPPILWFQTSNQLKVMKPHTQALICDDKSQLFTCTCTPL